MPKYQAHWFPLAANFYTGEKMWDAGPAAAVCFQYLCAKAHTDTEDGWVELEKWNPSRIWRWLGLMQDKFEKEEIADGMAKLAKYKLIEIDGDSVRPTKYDEWDKQRKRDLTKERVRRHREKSNKPDPDCNAKNVTCNAAVTGSNVPVTQCNDTVQYSTVQYSTEQERESIDDSHSMFNVIQDQDNVSLTPMSSLQSPVAKKIQQLWPDYPADKAALTAATFGQRYENETALLEVIENAHLAWPPGRGVNEGSGPHGWINNQLQRDYGKALERQAAAKPKRSHMGVVNLESRQANLMKRIDANMDVDMRKIQKLTNEVVDYGCQIRGDLICWLMKCEERELITVGTRMQIESFSCGNIINPSTFDKSDTQPTDNGEGQETAWI